MARILLVDDQVSVRGMLAAALVKAGHEVLEAGDGREGLDLLRKHEIDLLVADLIMPEKDGIELIRDLRQEGRSLPVLAISGGGHGSADLYLELARRLGASKTLAKPFGPEQLVEVVAGLLRTQS